MSSLNETGFTAIISTSLTGRLAIWSPCCGLPAGTKPSPGWTGKPQTVPASAQIEVICCQRRTQEYQCLITVACSRTDRQAPGLPQLDRQGAGMTRHRQSRAPRTPVQHRASGQACRCTNLQHLHAARAQCMSPTHLLKEVQRCLQYTHVRLHQVQRQSAAASVCCHQPLMLACYMCCVY